MLNRALIRYVLKKIFFELCKGKKPNISYFKIFDFRCFILINGKDKLDKFYAKSDEDVFLDYSSSNKIHKLFNKRILVVEEFIHIIFYTINIFKLREIDIYDDAGTLEKKIKK